MRRREFIAGHGNALASMSVWQCPTRAQQGKPPVVGYLNLLSPEGAAFRQGLSETGFIVGSNIEIEYRWAEGQYERSEALAVDLVRRNVSVICTNGPVGTRAAAATSASIPIVFTMGEDPLKEGIVRSLNRPGGNVTGFTDFSKQLAAKRLGLMHDTSPRATAFAMLVNPTHPDADAETKGARAAADALGLQLRVLTVLTALDLEGALASMAGYGVEALIVNPDPLFTSQREQLVTGGRLRQTQ